MVGLVLVVRTASDPIALAGAVKAALHDVDANVPLPLVGTMDEILARIDRRAAAVHVSGRRVRRRCVVAGSDRTVRPDFLQRNPA